MMATLQTSFAVIVPHYRSLMSRLPRRPIGTIIGFTLPVSAARSPAPIGRCTSGRSQSARGADGESAGSSTATLMTLESLDVHR